MEKEEKWKKNEDKVRKSGEKKGLDKMVVKEVKDVELEVVKLRSGLRR